MPELPDLSAYMGALETRIVGRTLEHVRVNSAFLDELEALKRR
jgi:formamidopyrimidine-DNA glycosylase